MVWTSLMATPEPTLMKTWVKKIVPSPMLELARDVAARSKLRRRPRLAYYAGTQPSVLQCMIAYNRFGGYCVPRSSSHRPAAQSILSGEVWEPETIQILTCTRPDGDLVHAGTYFGDFLPALAASRSPGRKVWAFEPNPENHRCAALTKQINDLVNVELTHAGLGERRGTLALVTSDENGRALGGGSRFAPVTSDRYETKTVDVVTIDESVPPDRDVAAIHLDVEGFERQALTGAMSTIRRCKPSLVLETLPEESWLAEHLRPLGYRVTANANANTILTAER
jgi:FkbM family methyltransferase